MRVAALSPAAIVREMDDRSSKAWAVQGLKLPLTKSQDDLAGGQWVTGHSLYAREALIDHPSSTAVGACENVFAMV